MWPKREQELLKETSMTVTEKLDHLSGQEKSLSTERAAVVQSVIEYTQQCVKHSTDDEIMCMHGDIQSRIDRETKEHQKEGKSLEPVEEVDVGLEVSCAEDLHQLFQTKTKIIQLPIKFNVKEKTAAEVNKKSELSLLTNLSCTKRKYAVECQLKSLCNGSVIKCNVDQIKGQQYRILYTPTVRGRHELMVTANGQEVAGSPFPVFVSIHPSQLGKPVWVITGVEKSPRYLTFNSVGEIIITEFQTGNVLIFDKKGKRMRSLKESSPDIDIKDPRGVAVDNADNIYIADHVGKGVIKLNKDLKILNKIDAKQDSSLYGVSVVGDEVMVCAGKNKFTLKN